MAYCPRRNSRHLACQPAKAPAARAASYTLAALLLCVPCLTWVALGAALVQVAT